MQEKTAFGENFPPLRQVDVQSISGALTPRQERQLAAVGDLMHTCDYDRSHAILVTRLALQLFDALQTLHGLGSRERFWLECAALLHEIGWVEGQRSHHKASLRIILTTPLLPFNSKERLIIGTVARYHRKALPSLEHDHFRALDPADRPAVLLLAGMLRFADGLDASHRSLVCGLHCRSTRRRIHLLVETELPVEVERLDARFKSDLLALVFKRHVVIKWKAKDQATQ